MFAIMGTDPKIIRTTISGDIVNMAYNRKSDNKVFKYRCKLKGNNVVWSTSTGRWRNNKSDSKIEFNVNTDTDDLTITEIFTGGSVSVNQILYGQF